MIMSVSWCLMNVTGARILCGMGDARGAVHDFTYDGLTVTSRAPPHCPTPLDSGFRRNDGGYAQHLKGREQVSNPPLP